MLTAFSALQLQGTLRIILEPLLVDKPFVGAVTVFFLQKPVSPGPMARPDPPIPRASHIGIWPKNERCPSWASVTLTLFSPEGSVRRLSSTHHEETALREGHRQSEVGLGQTPAPKPRAAPPATVLA